MSNAEENSWQEKRNNRRANKKSSAREGTNSSNSKSSGDSLNRCRENCSNYQTNGYNSRPSSYNNRQGDRNSRSDNRRYDNNKLVIYIRQNMVGKVIGRGGAKIKELQESSGAKINIDKSGQGDAAVTIFGSKASQNCAKQLIEQLTTERSVARKHNDSNSRSTSSTPTDPQSEDETPEVQEPPPPNYAGLDWAEAHVEYLKWKKECLKFLVPIQKVFYEELPEVKDLSDEQVAQIRAEKNNIEIHRVFEGEEEFVVPNPVTTFHQAFHNYPEVLAEIQKAGFQEPSPIQSQAWPILMSGRDMIGIAQTGTGKTLAFLLPALIHVDGQTTPRKKRKGPNVLIMAPTRELAQQISSEVAKYEYKGIKAVCLYGGGSREDQIEKMSKGVQIVIATPGRFNDLVARGALCVKEVTYLVLDEADRMLDLGFEPQIRKALIGVRSDRQTVMTSATWPQGVRRLAQSFMHNPVQVCVGTLDLTATHTVKQRIIMVADYDEKAKILNDFIKNMKDEDKIIVFFMRKGAVDDWVSDLALAKVSAQGLHGGKDQEDREQALADIKSGEVNVLMATDVASRGIDIDDITHVINFDFPRDIEEYVHRVGRTGRAGKTGESISLVTRGDWAQAKPLIAILKEANQEVPAELQRMADRYESNRKRKGEEKRTGNGNGGGNRRYNGKGNGHYNDGCGGFS